MKPSCSPTAVKMKSVCCSGTKSRSVWVFSEPTPLPCNPPEAMAIFACVRLYPSDRTSGFGSRKAVMRST